MMTALQELLAKVKAGDCDHRSFLVLDKPVDGIGAHHAYNGSLDATKAALARMAMIPNGAGARMDEMERQDPYPDDGVIEVGELMGKSK